MQYITSLEAYRSERQTAVTLGKFDGLHRGHQKLIQKVLQYAKADMLDSVVCSFDMAPRFQQMNQAYEVLMTGRERVLNLTEKVDILLECPFTNEVAAIEAKDFIKEILVDRFRVKVIVVGEDFRFGHRKAGDVSLLKKYADHYHYQVEVVAKERCRGEVISSTRIKNSLKSGALNQVEELLGYPYTIVGEVEHGRKLGRTIGTPTMNVRPVREKLMPPFGVYVVRVKAAERWYDGIANIGIKPTVSEQEEVRIESFLFDYDGDAYGKEIVIQLKEFVRPEQKFSGEEALKEQIQKDVAFAKQNLR